MIAVLRPGDQALLDAWLSKAREDPNVMPFLPMGSSDWMIFDNDYHHVHLLSECQTGLLLARFDRTKMVINIGVWVLSSNKTQRARTAMKLISEAVARSRAYPGFHWISSTVKQTNRPAITLNHRVIGEPWGVEPQGSLDPSTGEWIDLLHFKAPIEQVKHRLSSLVRETATA